jgi:hypothetical protein
MNSLLDFDWPEMIPELPSIGAKPQRRQSWMHSISVQVSKKNFVLCGDPFISANFPALNLSWLFEE